VLVLSDAGTAAIVAYILVYLLMNLGAFSVAGLIEAQNGSDHLDNLIGLGTRNPRLAAAMMFFLFSLVGLPPLAGFAVKWILLSTLWQHELAFVVVAILANTLFSLFYYMRIARAMYFSGPLPVPSLPLDGGSPPAIIQVPGLMAVVLVVCATGLIALFLGWGILNSLSLNLFAT
jgi:NADH-quinone oxidoreductase subunit N